MRPPIYSFQSLESADITINLVAPHAHRQNAAGRTIQTFKAHFIAILCGTDPKFPLNLWDKFLPQAEITLNLMRNFRVNPNLSVYCHVWGNFDFNKTPITPLGTKLLVHIKPEIRESWTPRATNGWYIGPALRHYRCYRVWILETNAERISGTIAWFLRHVKMPTPSNELAILSAPHDLT